MLALLSISEDRFGKQYNYHVKDLTTGKEVDIDAKDISKLSGTNIVNAKFIGGKFPYLVYTADVKRIEVKMITLYHGSDHVVKAPSKNHAKAKSNNDYGKGFYTTQYPELADEWALLQTPNGVRNEYTFDLTGLRVLDLDRKGIMAWIAEVMSNRQPDGVDKRLIDDFCNKYRVKPSGFDIIAGYRADDSYFRIISAFARNIITVEDVKNLFYKASLGKQVFLRSEKAFTHLQFVRASKTNKKLLAHAHNNDRNARNQVTDFIRDREYNLLHKTETLTGITFSDAINNIYEWSEKDGRYYQG